MKKEQPTQHIQEGEILLQEGTIEQFLRIRQAFGARFTGDGGHIAFLMNLTGTAQVYRILPDGGWPELLTDSENRVMEVWGIPHSSRLIFAMDEGGNENAQLYLIEENGKGITAITDNPRAMYSLGAISADGRWMAIATNARNGQDYDIYLLETGQTFAEAKLVHKNQGWWRALDFSQDNRRLLVVTHTANVNHDLYELDLETGALDHLTPHHGQAQYLFARYWGLEEDILMATDEDTEFLGLAQWERKTRALEHLASGNHDLDLLEVDRASQQYAYCMNQEGYSALYIHRNGSTRHIAGWDDGVIASMAWSPDGSGLALTYHSATKNPNVYCLDPETSNFVTLTHAPKAGLDFSRFIRPELRTFPSFDGLSIPVWLYRPQRPSTERVPVVISVHGGPESQERPGFNPVFQYLLARGFAIAAPNVRGSSGYGKSYVHLDDVRLRMNSVRDLAALAAWIHDQPGLDSSRIALMGGSYGGFMVLAGLTSFPKLFAAGVDIVGIANLETFLENTSPYRRQLREAEYGSLAEDREFFREISPVHHIDKIQAPLLVVHGRNDPRVPVGEAEQMVQKLRARKHPVEYLLFDDEGHGVVKLKNRLILYPQIAAFLEQRLSN